MRRIKICLAILTLTICFKSVFAFEQAGAPTADAFETTNSKEDRVYTNKETSSSDEDEDEIKKYYNFFKKNNVSPILTTEQKDSLKNMFNLQDYDIFKIELKIKNELKNKKNGELYIHEVEKTTNSNESFIIAATKIKNEIKVFHIGFIVLDENSKNILKDMAKNQKKICNEKHLKEYFEFLKNNTSTILTSSQKSLLKDTYNVEEYKIYKIELDLKNKLKSKTDGGLFLYDTGKKRNLNETLVVAATKIKDEIKVFHIGFVVLNKETKENLKKMANEQKNIYKDEELEEYFDFLNLKESSPILAQHQKDLLKNTFNLEDYDIFKIELTLKKQFENKLDEEIFIYEVKEITNSDENFIIAATKIKDELKIFYIGFINLNEDSKNFLKDLANKEKKIHDEEELKKYYNFLNNKTLQILTKEQKNELKEILNLKKDSDISKIEFNLNNKLKNKKDGEIYVYDTGQKNELKENLIIAAIKTSSEIKVFHIGFVVLNEDSVDILKELANNLLNQNTTF